MNLPFAWWTQPTNLFTPLIYLEWTWKELCELARWQDTSIAPAWERTSEVQLLTALLITNRFWTLNSKTDFFNVQLDSFFIWINTTVWRWLWECYTSATALISLGKYTQCFAITVLVKKTHEGASEETSSTSALMLKDKDFINVGHNCEVHFFLKPGILSPSPFVCAHLQSPFSVTITLKQQPRVEWKYVIDMSCAHKVKWLPRKCLCGTMVTKTSDCF